MHLCSLFMPEAKDPLGNLVQKREDMMDTNFIQYYVVPELKRESRRNDLFYLLFV